MNLYTWEELKNFVDHCTRCGLCRGRKLPVMGRGDLKSKLMLIAEAPGRMENQQGIPFVGRSGEVLDELLESVSLTREEIYITNINKCHPPGNRDPESGEQEACMPYLKYETALIRPKIMVCLGRIAAQRIIRPDFRITREHGIWTERKGFFLMGVYHPSALLRDPSKMEGAKEDFRRIREKLDAFL
ncbi:MAG: uracil-DNA glycosylase [Ruminococcus sp.]|jgi:uracil-DNA glycosylase family 4